MTEAIELLKSINQQNLYQNLLVQIEKDFTLSNESINIPLGTNPEELFCLISEKVYFLISNKFSEYLSLLYIIDVSENEIKQLDGSDLFILSQQVAFLILKREYKKVYYKNKY
ncbi:MAG: hypothetical protein ACOVQ2_05485 [Flavobacterium sp.]